MNTPLLRRRQILKMAGLSLIAATQTHRAAEKASVRSIIEAIEKKYDDALNAKDAVTLASLYLENAQILAVDKPIVKGRAAIEEFWKSETAAATEGARNVSTPLEVEEHGRNATETGTWKETKANEELVATGKYLVVWSLQGTQWKIHREIWNKDELPQKKPDAF
jgi:ketosteroid isomerase-like protein